MQIAVRQNLATEWVLNTNRGRDMRWHPVAPTMACRHFATDELRRILRQPRKPPDAAPE